jgi:nucleoside-diphosphate-sugar epimerase
MTLTIVTGAGGWLGRSLVRALAAEGRTVRCLARTDLEAAELEVGDRAIETVVGDVRNPVTVDALVDGATGASVVHAAAVIHPEARTREFFDVNVGGTALVVDAARRAGVRRLVYVSSNSPFGVNASVAETFDEDSPYNPFLGYGRSKMEAETIVRAAHGRDGLETTIVRCPWFYGPGQPERQSRFFAMVRKGLFPQCGDGTNRRSLAYVDNLVQGILLAERHPDAAGRPWWIADVRPYPMAEILEAVRAALRAEGLAVSRQKMRLPDWVAESAGRVDSFLQGRGRYMAELHVLSETNKTIACSVARAATELGYAPAVELGEGMRRSIRWCLQQGHDL